MVHVVGWKMITVNWDHNFKQDESWGAARLSPTNAKDAIKLWIKKVILLIKKLNINMIVGLIHGFKYKEESDGLRELHEARTRKILMYSNIIASSSDVLAVYITKNPKKLDIEGLLVTASRLFADIRFITRVKQEFVNSQLGVGMQKEIDESNRLLGEIFIWFTTST